MRFSISSEQREFARSVRELLAKADVPAVVRTGEWRPLWAKRADAGVTALGTPERLGGYGADFFATHQLALAFTWTGGGQDLTVQVLKFQAWTFLFGVAFVLGLYSMHRLSFVEETGRTSDHVVLRHLLLEVRRSVQSLSSAAGLLRIVKLPIEYLRQ